MAREYIAFISYRHLLPDMDTAKRLHKMIEHYTVPKKYRKNGRKNPGIVFRDQDELPLSSDLSGSIQEALDHSEFLIIIATPDWGESHWCREELNYFLKSHDRDHVLVVLTSGTPQEVIPDQLMNVTDEEGNVIRQTEPLCAGIAADTDRTRHKLLKREGLRIIAALVGSAYDELRQRERRYQRRKRTAIAAVIAAVLTGFIIMLAIKNTQVQAQYEEAERQRVRAEEQKTIAEAQKAVAEEQRVIAEDNRAEAERQRSVARYNESVALAGQAQSEKDAPGKRRQAIQMAVGALSGRLDRDDEIYYPGAEKVLTELLRTYDTNVSYWRDTIVTDCEILAVSYSSKYKYIYAVDESGSLYAFDLNCLKQVFRTELRGNWSGTDGRKIYLSGDEELLMCVADSKYDRECAFTAVNAGTGEILYTRSVDYRHMILAARDFFIVSEENTVARDVSVRSVTSSRLFRVFDWRTGMLRNAYSGEQYTYPEADIAVAVPVYSEFAVSRDGNLIVCAEMQMGNRTIRLIDTELGTTKTIVELPPVPDVADRYTEHDDPRVRLGFNRLDQVVCLAECDTGTRLSVYSLSADGEYQEVFGHDLEGYDVVDAPMTMGRDIAMIKCGNRELTFYDSVADAFIFSYRPHDNFLICEGYRPHLENELDAGYVSSGVAFTGSGKAYFMMALSNGKCFWIIPEDRYDGSGGVNGNLSVSSPFSFGVSNLKAEYMNVLSYGNTIYIGQRHNNSGLENLNLAGDVDETLLYDDGEKLLIGQKADRGPAYMLVNTAGHTTDDSFVPEFPENCDCRAVRTDTGDGKTVFLYNGKDSTDPAAGIVIYDAVTGVSQIQELTGKKDGALITFTDLSVMNKPGTVYILRADSTVSACHPVLNLLDGYGFTPDIVCPYSVLLTPRKTEYTCFGSSKVLVLGVNGDVYNCICYDPESAAWSCFASPVEDAKDAVIAGQHMHDAFAVAVGQDLYVMDGTDGHVISKCTLPAASMAINNMLFTEDDEFLLMTVSNGDCYLLRPEADDGMPEKLDIKARNVKRVSTMKIGDELLIVLNDSALFYDLNHHGIKMVVDRFVNYHSGAKELYTKGTETLYIQHRYSLEELLTLAEPYLD